MSNWKLVQEVNGNLNLQNRSIRAIKSFIEQYKIDDSDEDMDFEDGVECDPDNIRDLLAHATQVCDAMLKINAESYLSSGYQYDDQDPRNIMDLHDDNWWHRSAARTGSSVEDEMRSQITNAVVKNNYHALHADLLRVPGFREFWQDHTEHCIAEAEFEFDLD